MFTNTPADADKIFYCDATFDNNVEITKFNSISSSYAFVPRNFTIKQYKWPSRVLCHFRSYIKYCVLECNSEQLSPHLKTWRYTFWKPQHPEIERRDDNL